MAKRKVVRSEHGNIMLVEGSKQTNVGVCTGREDGMITAKIKNNPFGEGHFETTHEQIDQYCFQVHHHFFGDNWVKISAPTYKELKKIVDQKYGWTTEASLCTEPRTLTSRP